MNSDHSGCSPTRAVSPATLLDLLHSLPEPVLLLDASGLLIAANAACADLSPRGATAFSPGTDFRRVCAALFPPALAAATALGVTEVVSGRRNVFVAETCIRRREQHLWFSLRAVRTQNPGMHTVVALTDITRQKHLEEHLQHDAFHDTLTGLFNRAYFIGRLERAINRCKTDPARQFAVLYLDIDRFKLVNKTFGHVTGDRLLMVAANRLLKAAGERDSLARFGGDEFAVLVDEAAGPDEAVAAAERIIFRLTPPFTLRKQQISVTVSIGVVLGTSAYSHPDDILRDADTAMYSSKEHGGNHFTLFESGMRVSTARRMEMELDLCTALQSGEITVYYQPIVSLLSGRITGFEALARWRHPRYGMIPPLEFIPVAEETNLINVLGELVLRRACEQLTDLSNKFPDAADMCMNVNISARQFRQPDFADGIRRILAETGVAPGRLCLEVTESMLLEDAASSVTTMRALKDLGIKVVIDDFGTGYSSLSYLQRFPFDSLKVDRSFVCSMTETRQNREIIRTIIAMAENLGLKVVAEGVEMAEHRDMLMALRCEFAQGFLFSEPLDAERLETFLENRAGDMAPPS
jgi:Amt family ammonium transporter